ncbi:unnamed protein product [Acidithrix sp. C25]|nr:unnamed protein product [Acidithrix sp. C25]
MICDITDTRLHLLGISMRSDATYGVLGVMTKCQGGIFTTVKGFLVR